MHPASGYTHAELRAGLDDLVARGLAVVKRCPRHGRFRLYNYRSFVNVKWHEEPFLHLARGIVIDDAGIVALPFEKFFNHNEHPLAEWPPLVAVEQKMDGSLGIVMYDVHLDAWRVNTRGSFESPQAQWAEKELAAAHDMTRMPRDVTFLVEIICPESRVVVSYDRDHLHMLGAYDIHSKQQLPRDLLQQLASVGGFALVKRLPFQSMAEICQALPALKGSEAEGFVGLFETGHRRKFKGDDYLALHRVASDISYRRIFDVMAVAPTVDEAVASVAHLANLLPEEHTKTIVGWATWIRDLHVSLSRRLDEAVALTAALDDRTLGLKLRDRDLSDLPLSLDEATSLLFVSRKSASGRVVSDKKWKLLRRLPPPDRAGQTS